jgi:hypothetical protein
MNNKLSVNLAFPTARNSEISFSIGVFSFFLLLFSLTGNAQRIRYVSAEAAGRRDGTSWANASPDLKKMINASKEGDQIWVAANDNKPTNFNKVRKYSPNSGVKSYLMKLCTNQEESSPMFTLMESKQKVRIPKYNFQVLHSTSKANPPVFLVLQVI